MKKMSYSELESLYNLNQMLIDDVVRECRINNSIDNIAANQQLRKLNKNKSIILNTIKDKINEEFA